MIWLSQIPLQKSTQSKSSRSVLRVSSWLFSALTQITDVTCHPMKASAMKGQR